MADCLPLKAALDPVRGVSLDVLPGAGGKGAEDPALCCRGPSTASLPSAAIAAARVATVTCDAAL